MSIEHLCRNHPEGKQWIEGKAAACKHHEVIRHQWSVREGRKSKRRKDRRAGKIGVDRDGFISGSDFD